MEGPSRNTGDETNRASGAVSLTLVKRRSEESESPNPQSQDPTDLDRNQIELRLVNRSGQILWFTGYEETHPWYRIQRFIHGRWLDHRVGWFCGTGLRRCEIPAGKSSLIPVSLRNDLYPIRIGINYGLGNSKSAESTVWSKRIDSR